MTYDYVDQVKRKLILTLEDYKNPWLDSNECMENIQMIGRMGEAIQAIDMLEGAIVQKDERIRQLEKERDHAQDMYSRARYPDMTGS